MKMSGSKNSLLLLSKCPSNDVPRLLHSVVEGLCDRKPPNYFDYQGVYSTEEFWLLTEAVKSLFRQAVKNELPKNEVSKELESLPLELQNAFHECLASRREDVRARLMASSCSVGRAQLTDFDWQLKLIMGSDKISNVREPIASVCLNIRDDNKDKQVLLEMSKDELSNFIASLQNASKAMSHLQT